MDKASFTLSYDGREIIEGKINAKIFAPSILALAELVDETNKELFGSTTHSQIQINSDFKKGSFIVELTGLVSFYLETIDFINNNDHFKAWAKVAGLLGLSGFGLIQLLKKSKGEPLVKVVEIEKTETCKITYSDGAEEIVEKKLLKLLNNKVRKKVESFVKPLLEDGIEEIAINKNKNEQFILNSNDAKYFQAPTDLTLENNFVEDILLTVVSPSFKPGNKWRVFDGTRNIHVTIGDQGFKDRIEKREELFGNGDILKCRLSTAQWFEEGKLKSRYEIEEVYDHIEAESFKQKKLFN